MESQVSGCGNGTRAVAEQLHLSVHTIESHREKISGGGMLAILKPHGRCAIVAFRPQW